MKSALVPVSVFAACLLSRAAVAQTTVDASPNPAPPGDSASATPDDSPPAPAARLASPSDPAPTPVTTPAPPSYPPPPPGYPTSYGPRPGYPALMVAHPGVHMHDGFYLRMQLGPGYLSSSIVGADFSIRGPGYGMSVAIGGAVAPNLVAFGQIVEDEASSPELEIGGVERDTLKGGSGLSGVGGGVAYYLMPANVYFSASLLATRLSVSDGSGESVSASDLGLGGELCVGKEWWASDNWGLGVAFQIMVARMHDRSFDDDGARSTAKWNSFGLMLAMSATYN